jgi:hypothetical protein
MVQSIIVLMTPWNYMKQNVFIVGRPDRRAPRRNVAFALMAAGF